MTQHSTVKMTTIEVNGKHTGSQTRVVLRRIMSQSASLLLAVRLQLALCDTIAWLSHGISPGCVAFK
jgi:hypothetical protein